MADGVGSPGLMVPFWISFLKLPPSLHLDGEKRLEREGRGEASLRNVTQERGRREQSLPWQVCPQPHLNVTEPGSREGELAPTQMRHRDTASYSHRPPDALPASDHGVCVCLCVVVCACFCVVCWCVFGVEGVLTGGSFHLTAMAEAVSISSHSHK